MAKVEAEYVKSIREKVQMAKQAAFEAHRQLEATPEYKNARRADENLEMALDLQMSITTLLSPKVV